MKGIEKVGRTGRIQHAGWSLQLSALGFRLWAFGLQLSAFPPSALNLGLFLFIFTHRIDL
jgi:hypothetical protein